MAIVHHRFERGGGLSVAIKKEKKEENVKRGGGGEEAALPIRIKMHSRRVFVEQTTDALSRERRTPALDSSSGFQNFLQVVERRAAVVASRSGQRENIITA